MKKKVTKPEVSLKGKELTMNQLRELRVSCDALAAAGACGTLTDLKIKRLGQRAKTLFDDTIGMEIDEIKKRTEDYLGTENIKVSEIDKHPKLEELIEAEKELWERKANYQFEPVFVNIIEATQRGGDFSDGFDSLQKVEFRGAVVTVDPYASFLDLEEKGYITIE